MPKLVIVIIVMEERRGLILGHPGGKGRKGVVCICRVDWRKGRWRGGSDLEKKGNHFARLGLGRCLGPEL